MCIRDSSTAGGRVSVNGWLFDTRNTVSPQVLGKQYNEAASEDSARTIAHRFADEIILRLGGGINGIAETKIYFIKMCIRDSLEAVLPSDTVKRVVLHGRMPKACCPRRLLSS